jgi:tetratricopeptide (TPR) repeat protein
LSNLRVIIVVIGALLCVLRFYQMKFLSLDPRRAMGFGQIVWGKTDEAIAKLKSSEKHIPCENDFEAHRWLGYCYLDRKDWAIAKEEYGSAIDVYNKIFPGTDDTAPYICVLKGIRSYNLSDVYLWRGYVNARLHNYEQAVADYTKSIQTIRPWGINFNWPAPPGDGYARYERSICYYALGKRDLAEKDLAQLKKDGYWGYLDKDSRPNSSNWYEKLHFNPAKGE